MNKLVPIICTLSFLVSPTVYGEDSYSKDSEFRMQGLDSTVVFGSWDANSSPYSELSRELRFPLFIQSLCNEAGLNGCEKEYVSNELIHQRLQSLSHEDQVAIMSTHEFKRINKHTLCLKLLLS